MRSNTAGNDIFSKFRSLLVVDIYKETELDQLKWLRPGGVVVRRRFTESPAQLQKLIAAHQASSKHPLLVAANFEWGVGNDVKKCHSFFPGTLALSAACGREHFELIRAQATAIAQEARSLGVNAIFGPMIDVLTPSNLTDSGTRAFSSSAKRTADYARHYVRGLMQGGVAATAKHFPGYSRPRTDAHLAPSTSPETLAMLKKTGLIAFRAAINAGADLVMMGHPSYPRITGSAAPSTLSSKMVDIARQTLGFNGLIITDNMGMGSIAGHYSLKEALLGPIKAGMDLVLLHQRDLTPKLLRECERIILDEPLLQTRIEESYARLERFRRKWKAGRAWGTHARLEERSIKAAEKIAAQSITLLRDPQGLLPVSEARYRKILIISFLAKDGFHTALPSNYGYFAAELKKHFIDAALAFANDSPDSREINALLKQAHDAEAVVIGLHEEPGVHGMAQGKLALARKFLLKYGKKTVIAGMFSPAIMAQLPADDTALFSHSAMPVSQIALARAVLGKIKTTRFSPV